MKRLFAMLIAVAMLTVGAATAFAADGVTLSIEGDTTCAPGSTLVLAFQLEKGSNMCAADIRVGFDTDDFKILEYTPSDLMSQHQGATNDNYGGQFALSMAGVDPITEGGTLFTLEFQVDSQSEGKHDFYFFTTSFSDYDGNPIETETAKFTVNVTGKAVSSETVDPAVTASGKPVEAVDEALEEAATVSSTDSTGLTTDGNGSDTDNNGLLTIILVVVLVVVVALVLVGVLRTKKKEEEEQPAEYKPVLDEDAKKLLDMDTKKKQDRSDE